MSTVPSQEFNWKPVAVMRMADRGPVYVTDHGTVAYVVINIDDFRHLEGVSKTDLVGSLQSEELDDYDLPKVEMDIKGATF